MHDPFLSSPTIPRLALSTVLNCFLQLSLNFLSTVLICFLQLSRLLPPLSQTIPRLSLSPLSLKQPSIRFKNIYKTNAEMSSITKVPTPEMAAEIAKLKARYDFLRQERVQLMQKQVALDSEHAKRMAVIIPLEWQLEAKKNQKDAAAISNDRGRFEQACEAEKTVKVEYGQIIGLDIQGKYQYDYNYESILVIGQEQASIMTALREHLPFTLGGSGCDSDVIFGN